MRWVFFKHIKIVRLYLDSVFGSIYILTKKIIFINDLSFRPLFLQSHLPPPLQILLILNESSSICSSQDLPPPSTLMFFSNPNSITQQIRGRISSGAPSLFNLRVYSFSSSRLSTSPSVKVKVRIH
ncbi:hypothetical protein HanRHA438_Chr16g0769001 [Helianthus annuus]|nr:hypothetical protein HanRHA438_Chr16g0769001 [Helianthus annuus]